MIPFHKGANNLLELEVSELEGSFVIMPTLVFSRWTSGGTRGVSPLPPVAQWGGSSLGLASRIPESVDIPLSTPGAIRICTDTGNSSDGHVL